MEVAILQERGRGTRDQTHPFKTFNNTIGIIEFGTDIREESRRKTFLACCFLDSILSLFFSFLLILFFLSLALDHSLSISLLMCFSGK